MITAASSIVDCLDQLAPLSLAAEWDNVGLLLGDRSAAVQRIMTCLTVTPDTAAEAIAARAQLIVTHHPILFRALKRLTTDTSEGRVLLDLVRAGVAVYSPHTAFDNAVGGINDALAGRLQLTDVVPLRRSPAPGQFKVVVFVPERDLEAVAGAMFAAGAGHIGEYSQCSFRLAGTGTFFGSEASNPTIGEKGRREEVNEWRLEAICPEEKIKDVIAGLRRAHSYEEPAYDVYPLRSAPGAGGEGRLGRLPAPMRLKDLAQRTKEKLRTSSVQFVGDPERSVQKVALACGASGEFLSDAVRLQSDVFLTGELRFHDYLAALADGLALVLPGHYATERFGVEELAARLQTQWPELEVWASKQERDPVSCM